MPEVAPLVGAWIEIIVDINDDFDAEVAPLVGAWIEILTLPIYKSDLIVAPLVGAWIEISRTFCAFLKFSSSLLL